MKNPIGFMACLLLVLGTSSQSLVAGNQDGAEAYLVKGKFELPLKTDAIREQWEALGYSQCEFDGKEIGWSSERPERNKGEHTHPWYVLFAGKSGKMEFIIQGRRFVLEPGDELYYPKNAVLAARNLYDGRSEWFDCWKIF
jgi:hypothetical protein